MRIATHGREALPGRVRNRRAHRHAADAVPSRPQRLVDVVATQLAVNLTPIRHGERRPFAGAGETNNRRPAPYLGAIRRVAKSVPGTPRDARNRPPSSATPQRSGQSPGCSIPPRGTAGEPLKPCARTTSGSPPWTLPESREGPTVGRLSRVTQPPGSAPSNRSGAHPQSSRSATGITLHCVPEAVSVLLRKAQVRRYWMIPVPPKRWVQISRGRPARAVRRSMISRAMARVIGLGRRASLFTRDGNAALGAFGRGEKRQRGGVHQASQREGLPSRRSEGARPVLMEGRCKGGSCIKDVM